MMLPFIIYCSDIYYSLQLFIIQGICYLWVAYYSEVQQTLIDILKFWILGLRNSGFHIRKKKKVQRKGQKILRESQFLKVPFGLPEFHLWAVQIETALPFSVDMAQLWISTSQELCFVFFFLRHTTSGAGLCLNSVLSVLYTKQVSPNECWLTIQLWSSGGRLPLCSVPIQRPFQGSVCEHRPAQCILISPALCLHIKTV